ncbi:MAG: ABC transporter permease [bacterium]|nr:ABC transporter permease [Planctomycetota bacterium]HIL51386.1 ABC transporter permease [Planctomycetota bacterium]
MLNYIIRRLLWMIPTLFGITLLVFVSIRLAPGDPATVMMGVGSGGEMSEGSDFASRIAAFKRENGLDRNVFVQYLGFIGPFNIKPDGHELFGGSGKDPWSGLLALDLGTELQRSNVPILEELGRRLKVTLLLSFISILITYALSIPLGIFSATRQGTVLDGAVTVVLFLLFSIPTFWAGLMLILAFGQSGLGWLPVLGLESKDAANLSGLEALWDRGLHLIMPVMVYTYGSFAYLSRQMRVGMMDVIRQDYIRTARAKGLSERVVIFKHALRNSLIPVVTLFASVLPILIGGSVVVEYVFDIPGMGRYAYEGLVQRDYNIIMATTTFSAFATLIGILLSDITYALVDPRISYE